MRIPMAMFALCLFACQEAKDAQPFVAAGCTLVEAFSSDARLHQLCATEEDLAALAMSVQAARADAGPGRKLASTCKIIPHTTTCATGPETAAAIDAMLATRRDQ